MGSPLLCQSRRHLPSSQPRSQFFRLHYSPPLFCLLSCRIVPRRLILKRQFGTVSGLLGAPSGYNDPPSHPSESPMPRLVLPFALLAMTLASQLTAADPPELKVGIIGLDTSHAIAFTKDLNDPKVAEDLYADTPVRPQGHSATRPATGFTTRVSTSGTSRCSRTSASTALGRSSCVRRSSTS